MDEHCEINLLLFDGLTAHDGENNVVPGLAESWDFDEQTNTYTFHLKSGVTWHDGEPFTAADVKFTIEAIMNPDNGSENAPNFEDVEEITVADNQTISFRLSAPNVAFLDYMTMAILPEHLLEGEDMQTSDFFRSPVGTGPYKLSSWDVGQAIVLEKNESYFKGPANIDRIIFKIVPDDNAQAVQLESGELDLALLDPKNAQNFVGKDGFVCYDMKTSDYRGILFNFWNDYWTENKDIIPAVCYALDRQAIIDAVLLGQGMPAYGPLQRNIYNNENVEHYDYNPENAKSILESAGCTMGSNGYYERNGEEIGFVISVMAGEQDRIDIAQAAAQQKHIGQLGRQAEADGPGAAGDAEIQAHALSLRRHTEGIDKRRDGLRHAAGHCIERSRQGQALCRREKGRAAKQHQPAAGQQRQADRQARAVAYGGQKRLQHEARRRRATEQQPDGAVAHSHPGKIALSIGNQNAMDAPQGDLHQGIEPGRSFHCVASCEKYQAVSRSTTSP